MQNKKPLPWTAPDYKQNDVINHVNHRLSAVEKELAEMFERFKQHDLLSRVALIEKTLGIKR